MLHRFLAVVTAVIIFTSPYFPVISHQLVHAVGLPHAHDHAGHASGHTTPASHDAGDHAVPLSEESPTLVSKMLKAPGAKEIFEPLPKLFWPDPAALQLEIQEHPVVWDEAAPSAVTDVLLSSFPAHAPPVSFLPA